MESRSSRIGTGALHALLSALLFGCAARAAPEATLPPSLPPAAEDPRTAPEGIGEATPPIDAAESSSAAEAPLNEPAPHAVAPERTIKVATFNIQVFNRAKAARPETMAILAKVVRSYDVVAVQEIRDVSGQAPEKLLAEVNKVGPLYEMSLSPPTGQQPNDKGGAERYAFFYNTESIEPVGEGLLYDDAEHDHFQREPWAGWFRAKEGEFGFLLVSIHAAPDHAVKEIGALNDAAAWFHKRFGAEDDIILLGDFNAGCSYASAEALDELAIRGPTFQWIVPDDADTNVAASPCAYDRIVVTSATTAEDFTGRWGVDQAFADKAISDHYPVWAEFYVGRDTHATDALAIVVDQPPAPPAADAPKAKPAPKISDAQIRKMLIQESISSYPGNCPCPYHSASNGSRCGGRSAWSRQGGYAPLCYASDVSKEMVEQYRSSGY